jgi:hypothetical protein
MDAENYPFLQNSRGGFHGDAELGGLTFLEEYLPLGKGETFSRVDLHYILIEEVETVSFRAQPLFIFFKPVRQSFWRLIRPSQNNFFSSANMKTLFLNYIDPVG